MLLALSSLSLFATWIISGQLAAEGETTRLTIFFLSSLAYFLSSTGVFAQWYRSIGLPRYFVILIACVVAMLVSARFWGPVWLLTLPLACQTVLYLRGWWLWLVLVAILGVQCIPQLQRPYPDILYALLNNMSSFLFTIGCSWAIRREFETRAQLEDANEQLRESAEKIEALAVAEERNRLAREIHDGVAHHLTAANVLLEAGRALLPPGLPAVGEPLSKAQNQIRAALTELRDSIESRHERTSSLPLPDRIRQLIAEGGFAADFSLQGEARLLTPEVAQALFRIAQEALTNARKHAPEAQADLVLDYSCNDYCTLRAENADNQTPGGGDGDGSFGLLNLRQRVEQLGGRFRAGPDSNGKFVVLAELPT